MQSCLHIRPATINELLTMTSVRFTGKVPRSNPIPRRHFGGALRAHRQQPSSLGWFFGSFLLTATPMSLSTVRLDPVHGPAEVSERVCVVLRLLLLAVALTGVLFPSRSGNLSA